MIFEVIGILCCFRFLYCFDQNEAGYKKNSVVRRVKKKKGNLRRVPRLNVKTERH